MQFFLLNMFFGALAIASSLCYAETNTVRVKSIEQTINDLGEKYKTVAREVALQREVNNELIGKVMDNERAIQGLTSRLQELEEAQTLETQSMLRTGRQASTSIAFTAYLDHELDNLGPDHTIQFRAVELNEGGAYNRFTGVFTVPLDGVYMFTFCVEDYRGHRLWTKLVVDGELKASIVEWSNPGQNAQGSNTVFLRLKVGQSVWVAVDSRESGDTIQGWADLRSSTFSGAYMYP